MSKKDDREIWQGHRADPPNGLRRISDNHWSVKHASEQRIKALAAGWKRLARKLSRRRPATDMTLEDVPNRFYVASAQHGSGARICSPGMLVLKGRDLSKDDALCLATWLLVQADVGYAEVEESMAVVRSL